MLGSLITDPEAVESANSVMEGLGLLPTETIFRGRKTTHQIRGEIIGSVGWLSEINGASITGYEIHIGTSESDDLKPWLSIDLRSGESVSIMDGAISEDGKVWGCYIHGLFQNGDFRRAWLESLGWQTVDISDSDRLNDSINELADEMEKSLDLDYLRSILDL